MDNNRKNNKKRIGKKFFLAVLSVFTLLFILLLVFFPFGTRLYLEKWLLDHGADKASIEKISVNPVKGTLGLGKVDITVNDKTVLANNDIEARFSLKSLLKKKVFLEEAVLDGINIDLEINDDGKLRVGSISMNSGKENKVAANRSLAWVFQVGKLVLTNSKLSFKNKDIELELEVEKAVLEKFSTNPDDGSFSLSLVGRLNNTPVQINLDSVQLSPGVEVVGGVKVDGFQVDTFRSFVGDSWQEFTASLFIDGHLHYLAPESGGLKVDYDGKVEFSDTKLAGKEFSLFASSIEWGGGKVGFQMDESGGMAISPAGRLSGRELKVDVPASSLHLSGSDVKLDINGQCLIPSGKNKPVSWSGELDLKGAEGQVDSSFSLGADLHWQGELKFGDRKGSTIIAGTLSGKDIDLNLPDSDLLLHSSGLVLASMGKLVVDSSSEVNGKLSLNIDDLSYKKKEDKEPKLKLGKLEVADLVLAGNKSVLFSDIKIASLVTDVDGSLPLKINISKLHGVELSSNDFKVFKLKQFRFADLRADSLVNGKRFAELVNLNLEDIVVSSEGNTEVNTIVFDKLILIKDNSADGAVCSLGKVDLSSFNWRDATGLALDNVNLSDFFCDLIRKKDGSWFIEDQINSFRGVVKTETALKDKTDKDKSPMAVKVGKVIVGGKSGLKFEDYTLPIPFKADLDIKKLELQGLDSKADKPFRLDLLGTVDQRAPLKVDGEVNPFADPLYLNLNLTVKNYPLTRLSAYTVKSVGVGLAQGQLNIKSKIKLVDNYLRMDNEIAIKDLKTNTISRELAAELDKQLPMPLETALDLLKNDDGAVVLSIPVEGKLGELDVDITDVFITALSKAIVPAASGYLMYTLGPYGALAWVGMEVGKELLKVRLPSVEFKPGGLDVVTDLDDYLVRVATILKEKMEADLQLTPVVLSRELGGDKGQDDDSSEYKPDPDEMEKLRELGQERAQLVKDKLVNDYQIDADRVLITMTRIESGRDKKPVVELQL